MAGASFRAEDLTVVIPTRERWAILARCLDALEAQDVTGFETVVVVDGSDQEPGPSLAGRVRLLRQDRAGPGVARNRGVAASDRPLVLLLGDDMMAVPTLVRRHLDAHNRRPDAEDAVLGWARWHPEAAAGRIQRWLEWSATQFDYGALIEGARSGAGPVAASWSQLYSSNVSLKRELFDRVGGFDPAFRFLYEDTDLGWRLAQAGMRLWFEPSALTEHLHRYDWPSLRRRFETAARAERLMASRHAWFEPWFLGRFREAVAAPPPSPLWPLVVDHLPRGRWRERARAEANRWYLRQLGPFFLNAWDSDRDLEELRAYLGSGFDLDAYHRHHELVEAEQTAAGDETAFYRSSRAYLYDLTAFASWDTKIPYRVDVARYSPPGARLLDYGCGIGSDGLRLLESGYRVDFADFDNPSTRYLRWRLERRGLSARVLDIEVEDLDRAAAEPDGRYHLAFAFDVAEHVPDPFALLSRLEALADLVAVNFLEPDPADTELHHDLPIPRLLDHAQGAGLLRYRLYHGRSHFVVYRSPAARRTAPGRARLESRLESFVRRRSGPVLSGPRPWRLPGAPGGRAWSQPAR